MSSKRNKSSHKTFPKLNKFKKTKPKDNNTLNPNVKEARSTIYSSLPETPSTETNQNSNIKIHGNFISRPRWSAAQDNKRPLGATVAKAKPASQDEKRPLGAAPKSNQLIAKIEQETQIQNEKPEIEIEKINYIKSDQKSEHKDQAEPKTEPKKKPATTDKPVILEETLIENTDKESLLISEGDSVAKLENKTTDQIDAGEDIKKIESHEAKQLTASTPQPRLIEMIKAAEEESIEDGTTKTANLVAIELEKDTPEPKTEPKKEENDNQKPKAKYIPLTKKGTFAFVVFVLLWAAISMIASQFVLSVTLQIILKDNFTTPLWTTIYDALVYLLTLVLVILVPPKLITSYRKTQSERKQKITRYDSKTPNPEKAESSKSSHSQFSNVLFKADTTQVDLNNEVTKEKRQDEEAVTSSIEQDLSTSTKELGLQGLPTLVDLGLAPIGYAVYLALASLFSSIMSTIFTWFNTNENQDVGFNTYIDGVDRVIAVIALVFLAPIAEEIVFRGWIYGKLRTRIRLPLAVLLTSLLFAVLHGQWNVGVSVFALSLVLCGLREVTGTIWSGIILHMLSNGIAFYLLYVAMV